MILSGIFQGKKLVFSLGLLMASSQIVAQPLINEFVFNHSGSDRYEYIEVVGEAKTDYSRYTLIEIEGDGPSAGLIDGVFPIATTNSAGYWTTNFLSTLENGTLSLLLVKDFTGQRGDDLDTDNDGVLDVKPWSAVVDSVAVSDGGATDRSYAETVLTQNYDGVPFTVGGASRIPDAKDTNQPADWKRNDFDFALNRFADAINTPNTANHVQLEPLSLSIMEIQGERHLSPFNGQLVVTQGIVTAVAFNGFYLQDVKGDNNARTSDAVFVQTDAGDSAQLGDAVEVAGSVLENVPGGISSANLSTTQILRPELTLLSSGNPLPVATVIGQSGRVPPNRLLLDKRASKRGVNLFDPEDAESVRFDPNKYGLDFFESLESMLVSVEQPAAVSALRRFSFFSSEVFTVANQGQQVAPKKALNQRGALELQAHKDNQGDQNPERIQIQFDRTLYGEPPLIAVGDKLSDVSGVVGYSFGNYEINATEPVSVMPASPEAEVTTLTAAQNALTVASYNVLNLSARSSDDAQREHIADQIVHNLGAPDIIALQEVQDNNGETNDGTVDATLTLQKLVDAIAASGGPLYEFVNIDPIDGNDGGVPGGNIRNVYLYQADRVSVLQSVSITPDVLSNWAISDVDAFQRTRKPLLASFAFNDQTITLINNHLSSRSGSSPIFGAIQPFIQGAEAQREAQAAVLNQVVDRLLAQDKEANIIVLGDFNTFQWTNDLKEILPGEVEDEHDNGDDEEEEVLENLVNESQRGERYTYIFDGNAQVLDHMFVSESLEEIASFDIVHVNTDFPRVDSSIASDHEPIMAVFDFDRSEKGDD